MLRCRARVSALIIMLFTGLAGCAPSATSTPVVSVVVTATTENVFGTLVAATPLPTATAIPTAAPTATPLPTTTPLPAPSSTPCPGNDADFVTDVTIPDGTFIQPGEQFVKTWRLRNSGSCSWAGDYSLAFNEGAPMAAPNQVKLAQEVKPGETVDVSVTFNAPAEPGLVTSRWQMQDAQGTRFGPRVYVKVIAGEIDRLAGIWRGKASGVAEGEGGAMAVSSEERFEIRAICADQPLCLIVPLYDGGTLTLPFSSKDSTAGKYCFADEASQYCFTPLPDGTLNYEGNGPLWGASGQLHKAEN